MRLTIIRMYNTSWDTRRCPGEINPILTHAWKTYIGPENIWKVLIRWNPRWGIPPCKLFVDSLEKWMIFDRNKGQKKLKSLGSSHFLNSFWPRKSNTACLFIFVTRKCTWFCSNNAEFGFLVKKKRQIKFVHQKRFSPTWEVYFYGAMDNPQLFKPDKGLPGNLPLKIPRRNLFPKIDFYLTRIIQKSYLQLCYVSDSLGFAFPLPLSRPSSAGTFSASSLSMDFRLIRISLRRRGSYSNLPPGESPRAVLSRQTPSKLAIFLAAWFLLALSQPIGFRGQWTSNSDSPLPKTPPGLFPRRFNWDSGILKKLIPIGSESTNSVAAEWTADSDSAPSKT